MKTLTYQNQTLTISEWSKITKIPKNTIRTRLKKGWTAEQTLTTPTRKYTNLRNKKFGKLTVKKRILPNYLSPNSPKTRFAYWLCQCSCGNTSKAISINLISGRTTSCGCNLKHLITHNNQTLSIKEWAEELNISRSKLKYYIKKLGHNAIPYIIQNKT